MARKSRLARLSRSRFRAACREAGLDLTRLAREFGLAPATITRLARKHGFRFRTPLSWYTREEIEELLARCDGNMSAAARATGSSTRAIKAAAEKHGLSWSPNVSGGTPSCLRRIDSEVLARVRANHRTDAEAAKSLGVGANTFWKECYRRGIPSPRPAHRLAQGSYTPPTFAEPTDDAWQARPRPFDKRNDPA